MTAYESLKQRVNNVVVDHIPVNLVCPHCEQGVEFESIIDISSAIDAAKWDAMAELIVGVIIDSLPDIIKEVLNK